MPSLRVVFLVALSVAVRAEAQTPRLHVEQVSETWDDFTFTPDGRVAAYSSVAGGVVQIVDVPTRRTIETLRHRGKVAIADDGASAVIGTLQGAVVAWKPGKTVPLADGDGRAVAAVALSPDGRWAVTASAKTVRYWDVLGERMLWSQAMPAAVRAVRISADGRRVLVCAGSSRILDGSSGQTLRKLGGYDGALSDDGLVAVTTSDQEWGFRLCNTSSGQCRGLAKDKNYLYVALRPDGRKVAAADDRLDIDLFDVDPARQTATRIATLEDYAGNAGKMQFLQKAGLFATALEDLGVFLFSDRNGAPAGRFSTSGGIPLAFESVQTDAQSRFVLAEGRRLTALWDLQRGGITFRLGSELTNASIFDAAGEDDRSCDFQSSTISADGRWFAAVNTCRHKIVVSETSPRALPRVLERTAGAGWGYVSWLRFSPTGKYLAAAFSGAGEQRLLIWDRLADVQHEYELDPKKQPAQAGFSADERSLWLMLGRDIGPFDGPDFLTVDLATWIRKDRAHIDGVACDPNLDMCGPETIAISADGRFVAYQTLNGDQHLRDLEQASAVPLPEDRGGIRYAPVFSCDGRLLLYGNAWDGLNLYDVQTRTVVWKKRMQELLGFDPRRARMSWSCRGDRIFVHADERLFGVPLGADRAVGGPAREYRPADGTVVSSVEAPGRDVVIAATTAGVSIFDRGSASLLLSLTALNTGPWLALSADGRFDTDDPERLHRLSWVMQDEPDRPLPIDIFMRDYFEPKLIPRVLGEGSLPALPPPPPVDKLNRNQPMVAKIAAVAEEGRPDRATVTVAVSATAGRCFRPAGPEPCESGVYDLRLYRDGQLVDQQPAVEESAPPASRETWREAALVRDTDGAPITASGGEKVITFRGIRLPQRPDVRSVRFTSYAFNEDRVKSQTAAGTFPLSEARGPVRPRAYIVTVGVDVTSADWRLPFAPVGARAVGDLLAGKTRPRYEPVRVQLLSEYDGDTLVDEATKGRLKTVLKILGGEGTEAERASFPGLRAATPDDLVAVYIASHGYSDPGGTFHVIPSDVGPPVGVSERLLNRCLRTGERSKPCDNARRFLEASISSHELTAWMQQIDAGDMTLILDSCHSAAVTGPDFKPGPLGDRGFGQLAYDKRMRVLAATEANNVAWGSLHLGDRSLLTEALAEPLPAGEDAGDLAQWLGRVETRVPELHRQYLPHEPQPQDPVFFDFTRSAARPRAWEKALTESYE